MRMRGALLVLASAVVCAALITVAALVPAPPAALPMIVLVCVICPICAASEYPEALAALRNASRVRLGQRHLTRLRSDLRRLPEVEHPLDY